MNELRKLAFEEDDIEAQQRVIAEFRAAKRNCQMPVEDRMDVDTSSSDAVSPIGETEQAREEEPGLMQCIESLDRLKVFAVVPR